MLNPLSTALARVRHNIPKEILELAFTNTDNANIPIPLEERIKKYVIRDRMIPDCNMVGGNTIKIPLTISYHEPTEGYWENSIYVPPQYVIYRIPPEARENLPIAETLGLSLNPGIGNFAGAGGGASVYGLAQQVLSSHTLQNASINPVPRLLSGDLIKLVPGQMSHVDWILECRLSYNENFENLSTSAMDIFGDWVVVAVKAYAYNALKISIDRAFIEGGSEIAAIKEIIDGYADANERYNEIKESFGGAILLDNDRLETIFRFSV